MANTAVLIFPASNCDQDAVNALYRITGKHPHKVWHMEKSLPQGLDLIIVPGGFSYGDYLRAGAIASRSPIVPALKKAASQGRFILGICNGFQILTECDLLPGALTKNAGDKFICRQQRLKISCPSSNPFIRKYAANDKPIFPIAHGEGRFFASQAMLKKLHGEGQVVFQYVDNPNGSSDDIAGICSKNGNILGLMPHPERVADHHMGRIDGLPLFESVLGS